MTLVQPDTNRRPLAEHAAVSHGAGVRNAVILGTDRERVVTDFHEVGLVVRIGSPKLGDVGYALDDFAPPVKVCAVEIIARQLPFESLFHLNPGREKAQEKVHPPKPSPRTPTPQDDRQESTNRSDGEKKPDCKTVVNQSRRSEYIWRFHHETECSPSAGSSESVELPPFAMSMPK
ncbi:MAG: hypothetical protein AB7K71_10185 [Polyangiaceae bacterium]